ncbi:MAG: V-type ATPase subunit [Planctomycetes bacterium]|nr:V-type ATPase subunit [Planctomycetota bacterium]
MAWLAYGTYAFVHARLGALKAELLAERQWEQLLAARAFLEQQRVLEATSYAPWVAATLEPTLQSIKNALHRPARKIERSVPRLPARFIRMWSQRDLLRNIKTLLKGKALGRSEATIRGELLELDPAYALPWEPLLRCPNVEAALDLLEATDLRHWIRAARRIYQRDPTLFGLDAALDRLYYPELWRQLQRLDRPDRLAVEELVSSEIDQANLLWLLRYRLNYRLSAPETYYLLIPVTGWITSEQLKVLVRRESLPAIIAGIGVEAIRALLEHCQSLWEVEVELWRWRARQARQMFRRGAFTLGEALAFLVLKDVEVRDLSAVLEGTRLGAAPRDIAEQLVGVWPH